MKSEGKSTWGGAREGAGRKPRLQYQARERFNEIFDRVDEKLITTAIVHAAKGDTDMLRWLIEQRMGKPPQLVGVATQPQEVPLSDIQGGGEQIDVMAIAARVSAELKRNWG